MKIKCPDCKKIREIKHVDHSHNIECTCGRIFQLDSTTVVEEYSSIDEDNAVPRYIGNYKVEALAGEGGMGKVYKAKHPALGITVAVKVLRKEFAQRKDFIDRFIKSARIAAMVDHPNIVRTYDCGVDGNTVFIVMEYLPSGTLADLLVLRKRMEYSKLLKVAEDMAKALTETAKHKIAHRDIKPDNIMPGADDTYKLSDLGLSKTDHDLLNNRNPYATMTAASIGTPEYMAPEQIIDSRDCDVRSDIYSLGVSLFELAFGMLPQVCKEQDSLASQYDIPGDFVTIVQKCMAKSPSDRYASPEALLADIEILKQGGFIAKPSLREDDSKRNKTKFIAAGICILGLAAAIPFMLPVESSSTQQAKSAKASPQLLPTVLPTENLHNLDQTDRDILDLDKSRELWDYAVNKAEESVHQKGGFASAEASIRAFKVGPAASLYSAKADEWLKRLSEARDSAEKETLNKLAIEAAPFLESGDFSRAAGIYSFYNGPAQVETEEIRARKAADFTALALKASEAKAKAEQQFDETRKQLIRNICLRLLHADFKGALNLYESGNGESLIPDSIFIKELSETDNFFGAAMKLEIGHKIHLELGDSATDLLVKNVDNGVVSAVENIGTAILVRKFRLEDLPLLWRLKYLEKMDSRALAVYAGVFSVNAGDLKSALSYFKKTGVFADQFSALMSMDEVK